MFQLRAAQRLAHAGGIVSPHAVPSALPQPPELQPVPGLAGLRRGLAALRVEHGAAAGEDAAAALQLLPSNAAVSSFKPNPLMRRLSPPSSA